MNGRKTFVFLAIVSLFFNVFAAGTAAVAETYVPKAPGSIYDDLTGDYGLLGIAGQFHVFAKEKTTINAHTDGNIATHELDARDNFGTNVHEGLLNQEINYIQSTDSFISSSGVPTSDTRVNKFVVGDTVAVSEDNGRPVVNGSRIDHLTLDDFYQDTAGNTYIDFDTEFAKLNTAAYTLMNLSSSKTYTAADFPDMNNRTIDLTGATDTGFVLVNIDADVLTLNTPLNIINPNNQIVVFNVVNSSTALAVQSPIRYNDRTNHETEDFSDANLSWNFGNTMANLSINAPFQGTILAPNADIHVTQSQDGTIIGTNVILDAATNRWDPNEIYPTPGIETVTISGVKTWDDNQNAAQKRPNVITVAVLQNGSPYQTQSVSPDVNGNWNYVFADLPKENGNGNAYVYTIVETSVPTDYKVEIDGYNLKNVYIGDASDSSSTDTSNTTDPSTSTENIPNTTDSTSTTDTTTNSTDTATSTDPSTDTTSTEDIPNTTDTTSTTDTATNSTDTATSTDPSTDTSSSIDTTSASSVSSDEDSGGASGTSLSGEDTSSHSLATTDTTTRHTGVLSGSDNSNDWSSNLEVGSSNKSGSNRSSWDSNTFKKYLPKAGSTSNNWLVVAGGSLVVAGVAGWLWRRNKEKNN